MNSEPTKSSEQLHKEVLRELDKVEMDIDKMKGRMSPGQFIDDAIFYPHGGDINAAFKHLKRNPVGSSFLAIGTLLLMEDEKNDSYETSLKNKARTMTEEAKKKISSAKNNLHRAEKPNFNAADEVKEGVREKAREFSKGLKSKTQDIKTRGQELQNGVRGKLSSAKENLREMDPLAFAAIGIGLGALTGASLAVSEKERGFVDNKLGGRISEFKRDVQTALDESASVLKDVFISDFKNVDVKIFNREGKKAPSSTPGL